MKVLLGYVIQDAKDHSHYSESIEIAVPPCNFSSDLPVPMVMEWVEGKQNTLPQDQKIIIISMYKI